MINQHSFCSKTDRDGEREKNSIVIIIIWLTSKALTLKWNTRKSEEKKELENIFFASLFLHPFAVVFTCKPNRKKKSSSLHKRGKKCLAHTQKLNFTKEKEKKQQKIYIISRSSSRSAQLCECRDLNIFFICFMSFRLLFTLPLYALEQVTVSVHDNDWELFVCLSVCMCFFVNDRKTRTSKRFLIPPWLLPLHMAIKRCYIILAFFMFRSLFFFLFRSRLPPSQQFLSDFLVLGSQRRLFARRDRKRLWKWQRKSCKDIITLRKFFLLFPSGSRRAVN